tara:strand:- start:9389 stop:10051 length:663 start_codon:yes stop_codon:yes gene_type:complete
MGGVNLSDANKLRIAQIQPHSSIYGPGLRTVIWTQGCTLACPGCWNTDLWSETGGQLRTVADVHSQLMQIEDVEGITLLGGEPLQQSEAVLELINLQRAEGRSIMLYTGYEMGELDDVQVACIDASDIAIMGRYDQEQRDVTLRWRGSRNQTVLYPAGKYTPDVLVDGEREVEVRIDQEGKLNVVGYPDLDVLDDILSQLTPVPEKGTSKIAVRTLRSEG